MKEVAQQDKIGLINFLGVGYVREDRSIRVLKLAHRNKGTCAGLKVKIRHTGIRERKVFHVLEENPESRLQH